jgi:hypothetical protein
VVQVLDRRFVLCRLLLSRCCLGCLLVEEADDFTRRCERVTGVRDVACGLFGIFTQLEKHPWIKVRVRFELGVAGEAVDQVSYPLEQVEEAHRIAFLDLRSGHSDVYSAGEDGIALIRGDPGADRLPVLSCFVRELVIKGVTPPTGAENPGQAAEETPIGTGPFL